MRLSQRAQYAICAVFDLAYNGDGEPVQARVVGERQQIPLRYLEQIFRSLRQAGLVAARRGPGGGYTLARAPGLVTLRQVVEAVEGPLLETLGQGPPPDEAVPGRPDLVWAQLARGVVDTFEQVDLESLCRAAAGRGVPRARAEGVPYQI